MREVFDVLRRGPATVNEIGAQLGLTHNAVRVHLRALEHEGLVRAGGRRHSGTRPAVVYEVVPRADDVLSGAYIPFVAQLLKVLGEQTSAPELDQLMQAVGRGLAVRWPRFRGGLGERVQAAALLLNGLGALTEVDRAGRGFVIRGHGCLLAEAVHGHPVVCRAIAGLVAELTEASVRECCEHGERPRCCFEISAASGKVSRPRPYSTR